MTHSICNDSHDHLYRRQELALRMIRHEARTCTIRECTGLTDDRIRRLYKTYASQLGELPVRRRRGRSPRRFALFVRNSRAQFESSLLASAFTAFGLLHSQPAASSTPSSQPPSSPVDYGRLFCDAFETHQQLLDSTTLSFEHAWQLLQLLNQSGDLHAVRCRRCDSYYLRDRFNLSRHTCPTCRLKRSRRHCVKKRQRRPCSTLGSRAATRD